jgi:V/A-type H+-transporting ATPase subunit D
MLLKLTKNELRDQEKKLTQLSRYLPTLQLKKTLLQLEVYQASVEIDLLREQLKQKKQQVYVFSSLFVDRTDFDIHKLLEIAHVHKDYENIAGTEVPIYKSVDFHKEEYFLLDTPVWLDSALAIVKDFLQAKEQMHVQEEKKHLLEKELRDVSIRVNLFEKVLIPRCKMHIKKIKIFLGDQQLAAVSQAKVAKKKILEKRMQEQT